MKELRELSNKQLWRAHSKLSMTIRVLREAWRLARCQRCREAIHGRIRELDNEYRETYDELWERVILPCPDCSGRCDCSGATEV